MPRERNPAKFARSEEKGTGDGYDPVEASPIERHGHRCWREARPLLLCRVDMLPDPRRPEASDLERLRRKGAATDLDLFAVNDVGGGEGVGGCYAGAVAGRERKCPPLDWGSSPTVAAAAELGGKRIDDAEREIEREMKIFNFLIAWEGGESAESELEM